MPVQLRTRLTCHYCGKRSNSRQTKGRKFKCEHCLAVNFLDENGEIADVPPEETESPKQYAQRRSPLGTKDESLQNTSMFCETCLKNQYLYTTVLSDFLPDPDAPNYAECEAALPAYMNKLEERYPQCCAQCEPKVRAQLQQATYNARSDHVRRMLERSRARRIAGRWGWRNLVVNGAGLGYFISLNIQIIWHVFGSRVDISNSEENQRPTSCFSLEPIPSDCAKIPQRFMVWSLVIGFACSWWNPKWQHRLQSREGRLVGLDQFYMTQFGLLIIRFIAWVVLLDMPIPPRFVPSLHGVFLALILIITGRLLFGIIKVDTTPLVNWHQDPAPLVSSKQFLPPQSSHLPQNQDSRDAAILNRPLSIADLVPQQRSATRKWQPPTPPADDADSMDWTPSQSLFQPNPSQPRFRPGGPSPFHGTLPALPSQGVSRLHNRPTKEVKQAIGLPPGFFDKPVQSGFAGKPDSTEPIIADPRFFPQNADPDTGLENIFEKVFSLQEPSTNIRNKSNRPFSQLYDGVNGLYEDDQNIAFQNEWSYSNYLATIAFFTLLATLPLWSFMSNWFGPFPFSSAFYILSLGAAIPVGHLLVLTFENSASTNITSSLALLFGSETLVLAFLSFYRYKSVEIIDPFWDKIGSGILSLLVPQEFYLMHSTRSTLTTINIATNPEPTLHNTTTNQSSNATNQPQSWNLDNKSTFRQFTNPTNQPSSSLSSARRYSIESTETTDSLNTTTSTASTISAWKSPNASDNNSQRFMMDVNSSPYSSNNRRRQQQQQQIPNSNPVATSNRDRDPFDMRSLSIHDNNNNYNNEYASVGSSITRPRGMRYGK